MYHQSNNHVAQLYVNMEAKFAKFVKKHHWYFLKFEFFYVFLWYKLKKKLTFEQNYYWSIQI